VPPHIAEEWAIWRVITAEQFRGQQLVDVTERWTLDDIMDANDVLDAIEDAQARAAKKAKKAKRHGTA
jgi:hypothetical protein